MSSFRRYSRVRISLLAATIFVGAGQSAGRSPQESVVAEVRQRLSRTGVFFRADAPAVLRNRDDPYLPVYLEIINGVEKSAHTATFQPERVLTRAPLLLDGALIFVKPQGSRHAFPDEPLRWDESNEFSFDARAAGHPLTIADRWKKTLEIPRARIEDYLVRHFIGGPFDTADLRVSFRLEGWPNQDFYLRVRLNADPLPQIPGWYRGDAHYHSAYTDNPAERGDPLSVTKQAALQAGLHWIVLADHSTDLSSDRYAEELRDAAQYRDGRFLFIRGEEVTVASAKESSQTTLHLLAMPSPDDPDKGFPSAADPSDTVIRTGDGSVLSPALPVAEALERIARAGGFAYAAHPFDPVSPLLGGGIWDLDSDFLAPTGNKLAPPLVGLEPWNRATRLTADDARDPFCLHPDADPAACFQPDREADEYHRLERGIERGWRALLRKGLSSPGNGDEGPAFKTFLAAGSDAHGDLDFEATMDVVDFLSKASRGLSGYAEDNALGKLSTVVFCPEGMGRRGESVLRALREGRSVLSNGPLLIAGFDRDGNGSLGDPSDISIGQDLSAPRDDYPPLQVYWVSSDEFGPFTSVRLWVGSSSAESGPVEIAIPPEKGLSSTTLMPVDLRSQLRKLGDDWGYLRLGGVTRNNAGKEFRCYTNPVWVRASEH